MSGASERQQSRMFTGLIEAVGVLRRSEPTATGRRLVVDPCGWHHTPRPGDSIAVRGVCLTVVEDPRAAGGMLLFDAVPETLAKTTLGNLVEGDRVHLEHAATPTTLLGGHVVQGHVDGVGIVRANGSTAAGGWTLEIECPVSDGVATIEYMVPKGSVAVDGVSLTLARVEPARSSISIALIPTTLEKTTLGPLRPGDRVNLECDATAKTVVWYLKHYVKAKNEK